MPLLSVRYGCDVCPNFEESSSVVPPRGWLQVAGLGASILVCSVPCLENVARLRQGKEVN